MFKNYCRYAVFYVAVFSLFSCGGSGGGNTPEGGETSGGQNGSTSSDNEKVSTRTYCIENESFFDASQNNLDVLDIAQASEIGDFRRTDELIQTIPDEIEEITSDHLFVSYTNENDEIIEELHHREGADLEFNFGFFVTLMGDDDKYLSIRMPILGYEGWLTPGKYTEKDNIHSVNVRVDSEIYVCHIDSEHTVVIDDIGYTGGKLSHVDMRFALSCKDKDIVGHILWRNENLQIAEGPAITPETFWAPPSHIQETTTTHLYTVGSQGQEYFHDQSNAVFSFSGYPESEGSVSAYFDVIGTREWSGKLTTMGGVGYFKPGLYNVSPNYVEQQFSQNLIPATMDWTFEGIYIPGQTTDTIESWSRCSFDEAFYVVDQAEYSESGLLELIDVRFTYNCLDGSSEHARILWDKNDITEPPEPAVIPDDLWDINNDRSIDDGNYLYLEGDEGEFLTQGETYDLDYDSARFTVQPFGENSVLVSVDTHQSVSLRFVHMPSIDKFREGFYGPYDYYDNHNPATGYVDIAMYGRGTSANGAVWYTIDHVAYEGEELSEIIARFEFQSDFSGESVRGKLVWSKDSTLAPSNPLPIPQDLPEPSDELQGACVENNSMRLQIAGDSLWNIRNKLSSTSSLSYSYAVFENIDGWHRNYPAANTWEVSFSADSSLRDSPLLRMSLSINGTYLQERLEKGYYANIYGKNPARGAIDISINSLTCSLETGWFAVDDVVYSSESELTKLNLRFDISCPRVGEVSGSLNWEK